MTYLVAVDGVLRTERGVPVFDMKILVLSLIENARVVFSAPEGSDAERFLGMERITGHAAVRYGNFLDNLADERSQGYVSAVLTPDTEVARVAFEQGVTAMLVTASAFANPKWRPDWKSWGEIVEESQ